MVVLNIAAMLSITSRLGFFKISNLNLFRVAIDIPKIYANFV